MADVRDEVEQAKAEEGVTAAERAALEALDLEVLEAEDGVTSPFRAGDGFSNLIGIKVTRMAPAYAEAQVVVTEQMNNLIGIPHGGLYFTLADSTFGAFSNYYDSQCVTLTATIDYLASAQVGDVLTAVARDAGSTRSIIRSEIVITNQDGKHMSTLHCTGFRRRSR